MMPSKGYFITFEGIDGSGKTTQARLLEKKLQTMGYQTHLTREPGGSPGSEWIRKLLLKQKELEWSDLTELLLFFAARKDHVEKTIQPALDTGKIVICDRFTDSTRIYQGSENPHHRKIIDSLQKHIIQLEPDLTYILSISAEEALQRTISREEDWRLNRLSKSKVNTLIQDFKNLSIEFPERCYLFSGSNSPVEIAKEILEFTVARFNA